MQKSWDSGLPFFLASQPHLSTVFFLMLAFMGLVSISMKPKRVFQLRHKLACSRNPHLHWLEGRFIRFLKPGGGKIFSLKQSHWLPARNIANVPLLLFPLAGLHTAPVDSYGNILTDHHWSWRRALYRDFFAFPLP